MDEVTIRRCSNEICVNGLQRAHEIVKATRPGYCSWCWGEILSLAPTAAVVKRLLDARDLLIAGTDSDALEFALGEIEAAIQDLGGSLPIYRVRGVMLHDTKEPDYTYVDEIFKSVDKGQDWIDGEFSDAFVDACTVDTEVDPTLEGYQFDDFEIVRVASPEFPIEVMEVM